MYGIYKIEHTIFGDKDAYKNFIKRNTPRKEYFFRTTSEDDGNIKISFELYWKTGKGTNPFCCCSYRKGTKYKRRRFI